jgi:hypothetical protein
VGKDFGGVAFRSYVVPSLFDLAVGADQVGNAGNTLERAAHEFLQTPSTVSQEHFVRGVAKEREIYFLLGFETSQSFFRVCAGAQDDDTSFVEFRFCVTKLGRFDSSTGSVGFGKEEQEHALALKILERDVFAVVGLEMEVGGFGAGLQHGVHLRKNAWVLEVSPVRKAAASDRSPKSAQFKSKIAACSRPYKG